MSQEQSLIEEVQHDIANDPQLASKKWGKCFIPELHQFLKRSLPSWQKISLHLQDSAIDFLNNAYVSLQQKVLNENKDVITREVIEYQVTYQVAIDCAISSLEKPSHSFSMHS